MISVILTVTVAEVRGQTCIGFYQFWTVDLGELGGCEQILLDGCHDSSLHRCQTRRVITDDKKLLLLCYCFSLCRSSLLGCLRLCIIQILFLIYVGILGISRRTFLLHAGTMAAFSFRGNTSPRRDFSFFLTVT